MKIAMPVMSDNGMDAMISEHFGHAPYYAFVTIENGEVKSVEFKKSSFEEHNPGDVPHFIHQNGANVLIVRGMGGRAVSFFENLGIEVYKGFLGTLKEGVDAYLKGTIRSTNYEVKEKYHKREI